MVGDGRSVGIRTRGLLDPNQARYQTSPHPVSHLIIMKEPPRVKSKNLWFSKVCQRNFVKNLLFFCI